MAKNAQKLKMLHLAQILEQETDDEHGLTVPQLIEKLAERGVKADRKTLYEDLKCLAEFGYDVQSYRRSKLERGLASRDFQESELLLLADAVQSSRFLTAKKADELVEKISGLGSRHMAKDLAKKIHVEGRIGTQNESVYYNVDAIQRAITAKKKIEFRYFRLDEGKRRIEKHEGRVYVETPVQLIYMNDFYYLVAWNDKHARFVNYRVDRMRSIDVSRESAVRNEEIATFDAARYQHRVFGMFGGEPVSVKLLVKASAMGAVVDRFGADVATSPAGEGLARVSAVVLEAPTFYGWLTQFGDDVVIESPEHLRESYAAHLEKILDLYRNPSSPRESNKLDT